MNFHIVVLPGDGIGPEIIGETQKLLNRIGEIYGHKFEYETQLAGGAAIDKFDSPLPDATLKACQNAQAVLKGPFGGPRWDKIENKKRPEAGILGLRKGLDLYANLRPVKLYEALKDASTLKPEVISGTDMLIVRELISGIYFGEPRGIFGEGKERYGVNTEIYRTPEVERIVKLAFELARLRRKKVCSVEKFNVLESSRLWKDVAEEVARGFPDVKFESQIVDNAAMQLIRDPKQFDVMVTTNMFGDILSDEASMLTGSLGMLPSASIGGKVALYEPSHGSAPDITGTGKANPLATILSAGMMLKYSFHLQKESDAVEAAVEKVLASGLRTADLARKGEKFVTCAEMGAAVLRELK
ncbi:MAG TPA: 3-isopropylmalate dehydrogenase [Planctomycetota bacterium]|nr:3-isopropylmalate dehydrogenase [Planctomycetota bacterium]